MQALNLKEASFDTTQWGDRRVPHYCQLRQKSRLLVLFSLTLVGVGGALIKAH